MRVNFLSTKKAQAEIIGLAVLVILLVFIFVIALKFNFSTGDNSNTDVRKSLTANNLLNAIIKEQGKTDIKELVNRCYIEKQKGQDSGQECLNLKNELGKIFSIILGKNTYNIKIRTEEAEFFKEGTCEKGIESTLYRFKQKETLFIASLRIC